MRTVDLRRDTITLPTESMRAEAFAARLGDSVYGEDPSQVALEELAADRMSKSAALFLPSGTMGNLVALLAHTNPGDEVILEEWAHIKMSETGGAARVAGLMIRSVASARGEIGPLGAPDAEHVLGAIRADDVHYPATGLICLEAPHHRHGGVVPPLKLLAAVRSVAEEHQLPIHLDGARLYNAAAYLGVDPAEIARQADSVMVSLSKGLAAPVGSVLCGPEAFIDRASRFRKMLGGGMRQTGWLCASGLVALSDENFAQIERDNANAARLAAELAGHERFTVRPERTHTNYVILELPDSGPSVARTLSELAARGVRAVAAGDRQLRFVTSRQVEEEDVPYAAAVIKEVLGEG